LSPTLATGQSFPMMQTLPFIGLLSVTIPRLNLALEAFG
jgi:hypothetical protein